MEKLCDILLPQNLIICKSIAGGKFTEKKLYEYFLESAQEIKLLKKTIAKPLDGLPVELRMTKEEKCKKIQNDEYDKLVSQIEQIKNNKTWDKLNNENDELITRLNRLEPVKRKIAIDRPPRKFWLLKCEFVDEPRDEQLNLPKYAFQYDIFDEEIERMAQNECYDNFDQLLVKTFLRFKEKED